MTTVLITAFEPYDRWKTNASWLALVELTRDRPTNPEITTRLYPVDFSTVRQRLSEDLKANYDFALHLGQAPGSTRIQLEAIAINVGGSSHETPEQYRPLTQDGPIAYRSPLPLADWACKLHTAGIPAQVSYHAGTYLCNASLYLSCYLSERMAIRTRQAFVHLPLDVSQAAQQHRDNVASLPTAICAAGIRMILDEMAG